LPIDPPITASFARDEDGAVAVIVSLLMVVLLGFVALGVDVASLYRERANLQADSDLTAMSSVAALDDATARARHTLQKNNRGVDTLAVLQTGRFLRNPAIAREEQFIPLTAGSPGINSVLVTLRDNAPLHFAKIFTEDDFVSLSRTATAIRTGAASFSLTSNIVRLDSANLNAALSQSFGATIALSAGDMDILAQTSVNLGDLLAALDRLAGNVSRNPAAILDAQTKAGAVIAALRSILPAGLSSRLAAIETAAGNAGLPVAALIGGIDTSLGLTAVEFVSQVDVSALDVVSALANAHAYQQQINADVGLSVSNLVSVSTRLAIGEPPAMSGWIAMGEEGVQLHRAAARLLTKVEFAPTILKNLPAGVTATRVNLPLYVEVAGASATLTEISCAAADPASNAARFLTGPTPLHPLNGTSVAALYLGKLDENVFTTGPIDPSALDFADILGVSLRIDLPLLPDIIIPGLTVQARSSIAVGTSKTDTVSFTHADIAAGRTTRGFGSGDLLASGINGLLSAGRTEVRVKPGQQGLVTGLVASTVNGLLALLPGRLLADLAGPLDAVIDSTLESAGVRLGEGELTLTGHHCELVRLVQ